MFHKILSSLGNSVAMLFLSSLFVASATGATASQDRWQADRIIFEGRIVGVQIVHKRDDRQLPIDDIFVLQYQFAIDQHFATMAVSKEIGLNEIDLEAARHFRFQLALTREQVDLAQLTEEHFLDELEKALPAGLHFGQPCLVVVQQAPTWGQYIQMILPATEANRKAFLEEHRPYILRYRRFRQYTAFRILCMRHGTILNQARHAISFSLETQPRYDDIPPESRVIIDKALEDSRKDYEFILQRKEEMISRLKQVIQNSTDPLEKRIWSEFIPELEERFNKVVERRRKTLDVSSFAPGYQSIINATNPDIISGDDDQQ